MCNATAMVTALLILTGVAVAESGTPATESPAVPSPNPETAVPVTPNDAAPSETPQPLPASDSAAADAAAVQASVQDSVAAKAATGQVQVIGTPVAVVRSGPGPQHAIVATVHEDDVLTIDARSGAWYHLQLADAKSGWVHEDLLRTYVDPRRFEFVPDPGRPSRQRSFHMVAYGGTYAADREDNGMLLGARIGYSLTRRFAFEAGLGYTSVVRTTYVLERIYGLRLEEEKFQLIFYEVGGSMDILPGRRVSPFLTVAAGASVMNSRAEPTYAFGVGTKFFCSQRVALRWELRDHHLSGGNQFTRFSGDNLEFSGGFELLF